MQLAISQRLGLEKINLLLHYVKNRKLQICVKFYISVCSAIYCLDCLFEAHVYAVELHQPTIQVT